MRAQSGERLVGADLEMLSVENEVAVAGYMADLVSSQRIPEKSLIIS